MWDSRLCKGPDWKSACAGPGTVVYRTFLGNNQGRVYVTSKEMKRIIERDRLIIHLPGGLRARRGGLPHRVPYYHE